MKNTISKGFHRTGILFATPIFIFGLLFLSADTPEMGMLISLICALFVYGALRLVGWTINGFIKGY
ncbi:MULTISPECIES: hypothetical protein [Citrobacter freundii complex]|uniref:Uncharacterized protein n=1 Tax=Citrobacter braakii TaxID=57706 RepID=A0A1V8P247_CITBR|nr:MULTISPECIES: hypothetical protein [Citrobacter freundii complex]OPW96018.1 hypothetical protein BZK41_13595 [Citrobacter sp. A316]OQM42782.1 hypothetical protein BZK42_04320 [Citrobacter braakii]QXC18107.1 hypothetical protein I6L51_08600 [Citrobacter braakii]